MEPIREATDRTWTSASTAEEALARACEHLLSLQDDAGWWKGELETNVSMDAEDMMLREFLGVREQVTTERTAAWIRSKQRADGSWANFFGGPGELSTSIEAYVALRLAGDHPELEHMRAASAYIRRAGGVERARVFTHIWLALFGLWSWDHVPTLPAELIFLPAWFPLNVYDFACWARQTVVALSVVLSHRPRRPLPFGIEELCGAEPWSPPRPSTAVGRALVMLDRVLQLYQRHPIPFLRRASLARAERWIVDRQEADGSWGGIQPPMVYSMLALHLRGYDNDHPVIRRGLDGLERFTISDDGPRRVEACQSPVWDTALAMIALSDAGLPADHEALSRGAEWLLGEQIPGRGDWAVRRAALPAGGWAFEFANVNYPDVDDTAEVLLALRTVDGDRRQDHDRDRQRTALAGEDAELRWRLGRVRRRQLPVADARGAVLRLRRGDRPAERRRHRTRGRGSRGRRTRRRGPPPSAACSGFWTIRKTMVRGLAAGASTTSTAPARSCRR